ncbi:hypothetical protein GQF01_03145 [Paenibacillus sp. 5J-6]|uniref:Uncharacterized protein n=1 Tax=Paenibacillus silvestris TaxID=2606219 RepID=A0A6L8UUQ3_9BACL|nr:hypothetical protein [Paenibacillus silvestris]MZQ81131.1 hypothetical protein [Paenibacillus silvestris]
MQALEAVDLVERRWDLPSELSGGLLAKNSAYEPELRWGSGLLYFDSGM